MLIAILIILFLIIVTMFYSIFRIQKNYKLDIEKNTIYREILYIKALLVLASIVLVFFGWDIQSNIVKKLTADMGQDLKKVTDQLGNEYGVLLSQKLQASEKGNIVEISLKTLKEEIYIDFKDIEKDIYDRSINNGKNFENIPIVSLNYVGQPYTITDVTNEGFTVKRLAIFEGYTIDKMGPPSYDENKLIIWIINRD
ncbi:MAG: hypothetical protein KAS53_01625 [Candidatus Cloacimonetes bacterium]|nr:hypothetical protein [Candidatus Cloacimonadota bacterium]